MGKDQNERYGSMLLRVGFNSVCIITCVQQEDTLKQVWTGSLNGHLIIQYWSLVSELDQYNINNNSNPLAILNSSTNDLSLSLNVRDKFTRLVQIGSILQLDRVNEILDYWGENSGEIWRLLDTEVKKVLSLRTDFQQKDINALKLWTATSYFVIKYIHLFIVKVI